MSIRNLFALIHQQNDKKQSEQKSENDEGGDDGGQFAAHDACEATLEPSGGCRRKDKKARGGEGGAEGGVEDGQGVCQQEVYMFHALQQLVLFFSLPFFFVSLGESGRFQLFLLSPRKQHLAAL